MSATAPPRRLRGLALAFAGATLVTCATLASGRSDGTASVPPQQDGDAEFVAALTPFAERFCIDCHGPEESEGGLDLVDLLAYAGENGITADLVDWRTVREKLRHREMPPATSKRIATIPRPDEGEFDRALRLLDDHLSAAIALLPQEPGAVTARRLNRAEVAATLESLFGVTIAIEDHLPPDDVGEGFDHIGDVLGLPPMLFERWVGLAEEVARRAVILPTESRVPERVFEAEKLRAEGGARLGTGGQGDGVQHMYARSTVSTSLHLPADGTYTITLLAFGQQAGPEPVKLALEIDGKRRKTFEIPEVRGQARPRTLEVTLPAGVHTVGATFVNDYYRPNDPDPKQRDRNAAVRRITVTGPLEGLSPTAFQTSLWPEEPAAAEWRDALDRKLPALLRRVWRRPVTRTDVNRFLDLVERATPADASASDHLRTALVAMLVSPRFIFRLEGELDGEPGSVRALDGHERATRLSYFLHGTTPSPELLRAAAVGELDTIEGVRRHAARLLADPASRTLAERFVPQWLQFAHLPNHDPDPNRFRTYDSALAADLIEETITFFDHVGREGRPITELITADYAFLNARLARHYGIEWEGGVGGVEGNALRKVTIEGGRGGGLLAQGSILTATSSPARTSPAMRGKWILEALLDSAPPPAPPGAGTLPEPGQPGSDLPLRQQMEQHRRDPICASCHVRMDPLGFALEEFDAVGGWRRSDPEATIDARGELPDGRVIDGVDALRDLLATDRAFLRALSRNLLVYALGRGLTLEDEPALELCIARLEREPTIPALIDEVVGLRAFLERRVPERAGNESAKPDPARRARAL